MSAEHKLHFTKGSLVRGGILGVAFGAAVAGGITIAPHIAAHEAALEAARTKKVTAQTVNTLSRGDVSLVRYHRDSFYLTVGPNLYFREGQKAAADVLTEEFGCKWIGTANTDKVKEVIMIVENGGCVPGRVLPDPYTR